ncbi:MAG: sugar transferase, partial [Actinomycetota bacterium]
MSGQTVVSGNRRADKAGTRLAAQSPAAWTSGHLRHVITADVLCGLGAGLLALELRFDGGGSPPLAYLILSLSLPFIWLAFVALAGGYDTRFIGVGSDEFRRVLNAGVTLTAAVAILSYASKSEIARGYVVIALPCLTSFDLAARFVLRKRLHRARTRGGCMRRVVA